MVDIKEYERAMTKFYNSFYPRMDVCMTIDKSVYYLNLNQFICNITQRAGIPGLLCKLTREIDEMIQSFVRENYEKINFGVYTDIPTYNFDNSPLNDDEKIHTTVQGIMKLRYREYRVS